VSVAPYRADPPKAAAPVDGYAAAWASLHRRRRLGPIGTALLVATITFLFLGKSDERFAFVIAPLVVACGLMMYGTSFRCPRCDKTFGRRGWSKSYYTKACMHCGLQIDTLKGTPRDPSRR
jgi:hypothetical protein